MRELFIPEEFIIIGAALELDGNDVRLNNHVSLHQIKQYLKILSLPITYDEEPKFTYVKESGDGYDIINTPPLSPQIISILMQGNLP